MHIIQLVLGLVVGCGVALLVGGTALGWLLLAAGVAGLLTTVRGMVRRWES
ncbi:hypothetical protein [Rathayibacter tanaceti]|uniref:Uncharacterized protein n=2 Tax=Rathayibacter tanaceti TaxID=1671680 RepID=A0A166H0S6_9MICO|nr:hypothetical protein [Rathayibacter tanaceti]KZX19726.1 hypothetical protein ACH61_03179 [Rathayibacter tanaceti]QHC54833.1 hypothetical protein GSU10_03705 [Rathayibacter tanaceti]TCO38365.1 hypothetical protein EV639_1022 [Rathayibacter tanaceti]